MKKPIALLVVSTLLAGMLGGCVVQPVPTAQWVPAHYGPYGGWIPGHWR